MAQVWQTLGREVEKIKVQSICLMHQRAPRKMIARTPAHRRVVVVVIVIVVVALYRNY